MFGSGLVQDWFMFGSGLIHGLVHGWFIIGSWLLHGCFRISSGLFQDWFMVVSGLVHGCFMVGSGLVQCWFSVGSCWFRVDSALVQGCYKSFPTLIVRALIHIFISSRASLVQAWSLPGTSFRLDFSGLEMGTIAPDLVQFFRLCYY